jgi:hypothetical protein
MKPETHRTILRSIINIISETNGISLVDTLDLLLSSDLQKANKEALSSIKEFRTMIREFQQNELAIQDLLAHPVAHALFDFFRLFPLKYQEDHTHLTGALTAEFIWPRLKPLLDGPNKSLYEKKIKENYGESSWPIKSVADVDRLIRVKDTDGFMIYLKNLYLPKLILINKQAHIESAYHIASELYKKYNVGKLRLKFTFSRSSSNSADQIPGADDVPSEDVVLGLYEGFAKFKKEYPDFQFVLSPSFRKEANFFDSVKFKNRKEAIQAQVDQIVDLIEKHPFLKDVMTEVDTVGSETELYRKEHFKEFERGFRKLQYRGFKIRSHHGETFHTLKKGIQAVDNAMNIWHIDTLEHGISLGINPNFYFHRIYQRILAKNRAGERITSKDPDYQELTELDWGPYRPVLDKLLGGDLLDDKDNIYFIKAKFHTAREVEHYQHDVLNRLIQKGVSLVALPSSNNKLTGQFEDYKDHPFSWWEKKAVNLGVGTDNYVTLNTNFIREMLIVLFTDFEDLKITKLLMVVTGENRRPHIAHLLWTMRKMNLEKLT